MSEQMNSEVSNDNENNEVHPERLYRPEVIDMFVKAGIELFCRDMGEIDNKFKTRVKETNVSYWLFFEVQANKMSLGRAEFNDIVRQVYASATSVIDDPYSGLTVGQLRKNLESLPDNAPVFYQRIEDSYFENNNWKTQKFVWESSFAKASDIKYVNENPSEHYDIKEINDKTYLRHFSKYIHAHSAYKVVNDDGKMAFVLNAHY